jgi:hypothetical protein
MTTAIHTELDADGILLLTIDVPGQSMNVITPEVQADLAAAIERLKADETIKGAVLTSGKASGFMAGADLKGMGALFGGGGTPEGKSKMAALFDGVFGLNKLLRDLETCGKPVAAVIPFEEFRRYRMTNDDRSADDIERDERARRGAEILADIRRVREAIARDDAAKKARGERVPVETAAELINRLREERTQQILDAAEGRT